MFQRQIAQKVGCSLRTVQRALKQARELGLIICHRSKPNEKAPGLGKVVECGWSHRWAVGWGEAVEAARVAVNVARAKVALPGAFGSRRKPPPHPAPRKRWTVEEIDAELARRSQAPPE
jgi:DNA-binding Lrp family transcriptional regulator